MTDRSRAATRRIDRLAWRAHAFHRWAHHPLCREYEGEVLRLGRKWRLCRGCLAAGLGALLGGLTGFGWVPERMLLPVLAAAAAMSLWVCFASRRRTPKLVSRFLPLFLAAWSVAGGLHLFTLVSLALASAILALLVLVLARYRHRGPWRGPCMSCVERDQSTTCRGMKEILHRERAFTRLATAWRARSMPSRGPIADER